MPRPLSLGCVAGAPGAGDGWTMPILDITEYVDSIHGNPVEPPAAHQTMPLGAEPAQSMPFHKLTRIVRIVADVNARVAFGGLDGGFLPAGREMIRVVHPDAGFHLTASLAEADTQGSGDRFDALIALVTDPAKCARRKTELEKLEKAIDAKAKKLAAEQKEFAAQHAAYAEVVAKFTTERTEFEAFFTEHDGELSRREAVLADAQAHFESEAGKVQATLDRREADVTRREDAVADRARLVREDEGKISGVLTDLERRRALIQQAGL